MNIRYVSYFLAVLTLWAPMAHADSPVVTSFTATPASISNDYAVSLTWSISNGDGHELYFSCPEGVTLKLNGNSFSCNQRVSASSNASDSVGMTVLNVSGTTRTVSVTVYPKSGGVSNDVGAQTQTFTVTTASQPITNFTASQAVSDSGAPVTFTWTGVYALASNLQIDCVDRLTAYSGSTVSGTALPCGGPAFAADQTISGSATFTFVNTSSNQIAAIVHVMPAIRAGLYDSTHNLTASVAVNSQQVNSTVTVKNPSITSFIANTASIVSGVPFMVGWSTKDASSTNIQYACSDSVTLYSIGTATTTLPCGTYALETPLSEIGSTTLMAISKTFLTQNLSILMLPKDGDGIYQLSGSKTLVVPLQYQSSSPGQSTVVLPSTATTSTSSNTAASSTTQTPVEPKGLSHAPFVRFLTRGSKGPDVTGLQRFLGLNPVIFPENSASGFFGPATQRAVQRFQVKYGISKAGEQGYGSVGPKTRAKLNALTLP